VPTRKISCRLVVSHAGFEDEGELLLELYQRGLAQPLIGVDLHAGDGLCMFWSHLPLGDWQDAKWLALMRRSLRANQYVRMCENRFVTTESSFVDMAWFRRCIDANYAPPAADKNLSVWVGIDASVKRDSTAIVVVTWDRDCNKVRLVFHRIFQPSSKEPLDFEATVERTARELHQRFRVRGTYYDPYQMTSVAQRLQKAGVPMRECKQTPENLTAFGTNLYELIKGGNLIAYPDNAISLAVSHAIAKETPRGWKITKEKSSHKIDVVVALAMAAYAAVAAQSVDDEPKIVVPFVGTASDLGAVPRPGSGVPQRYLKQPAPWRAYVKPISY